MKRKNVFAITIAVVVFILVSNRHTKNYNSVKPPPRIKTLGLMSNITLITTTSSVVPTPTKNLVNEVYNVTQTTSPHLYKGIHILSRGRSGSSFLGQVLVQHERVFYLFEPGRHADYRSSLQKKKQIPGEDKRWVNYYVNMITSMYQCNFQNMDRFMKTIAKISYGLRAYEYPDLSDPDLCKPKTEMKEKSCRPITSELLSEKCKKKDFIVIKTIRLSDVLSFSNLVEHNEIDFKILQLIRDPRGRLVSIMNLLYRNVVKKMQREKRSKFDVQDIPKTMYTALQEYCKVWVKNSAIGKSRMASKYFEVRYEDISLAPMRLTTEIYDKLGLGKVSDKLVRWINNYTNPQEEGHGKFNVKRNSSAHAEKWRESMTYNLAKKIQNMECGKFMDTFGYVKVKSPKDLLNKNVSLIGKYLNL